VSKAYTQSLQRFHESTIGRSRCRLMTLRGARITAKGRHGGPQSVYLKPLARTFGFFCYSSLSTCLRQTEKWHAAVYGFVLSRAHQVGLMPDPYISAAVLHSSVEFDPRWPVQVITAAGVSL
jgi:hypothetical protein